MNAFTPEEHATVREVATLMARTLALPAHNAAAIGITRTEQVRPRHVKISISSEADDGPLVIGGKGTNAKTVRELSTGALPSGAFVETHLEIGDAPQERRRRDFGDLDRLPEELVREITEVVVEWHKHLGGVAPVVNFETTSRCDIWLVQGRGIPGTAMGGLRRVIGWACKVRGRNGFIEWESPR